MDTGSPPNSRIPPSRLILAEEVKHGETKNVHGGVQARGGSAGAVVEARLVGIDRESAWISHQRILRRAL